MSRCLTFRRLCWLLLMVLASAAAAAAGRDMARETAIEEELRGIDASLVEPFRAARIAADAQHNTEAIRLLEPVCARAPQFDPGLRRLGIALVEAGQRDRGLALIERAVAIKRSAANLFTLSYALAVPSPAGGSVSRRDQQRAWTLLSECAALPGGRDADILGFTVQLALELEDKDSARKAAAELTRAFPDLMQTHYFNAWVAAGDEEWIRAEDEILAAKRGGLDPATVERFLDSGIHTRALTWRAVHVAAWVVALWAGGLLSLFLLGVGLSLATLRQVERSDPAVPISAGEHRLRRIYRAVLNVAGLYYYVSLPIVLALVILLAGGLIVATLMAGFLAIKLILIFGIGAIATVWSMGRSLFLRVPSSDPGRPLERAEAEGLWKLTEEVAAAVDTRPVDEIRLTIGTDLCVYERGSWREKRSNRAKRVLVLGAAVLPGFKQEDFRSVLAHEYGHFSHRDTAGGDIGLRVRNDILKFYYAMVRAGQATWLNVAFHFLRLYHFLFRRISHGATRLQEVLADRVAAQLYGPAAFEGGLRHVIRQSLAFDARANHEVKEAIEAARPLRNLYEPGLIEAPSTDSKYEQAIDRPTTADDTHPGPRDRFRLISRIPPPAHPPAAGFVWDLFADREAILREMMENVEKNVAAHRR